MLITAYPVAVKDSLFSIMGEIMFAGASEGAGVALEF
jgi:hypothetical protein